MVTGASTADLAHKVGMILKDGQPMTLRGLFYQAVSAGLLPSTDKEHYQKLGRIMTIMRENGMRSCVAVSDGYHMYRVKLMMQREGMVIYASPRPDPHRFHPATTLEEVFKYTLWKLRLE